MPSLIAILGLNASRFQSGLNSAVNSANAAGAKIGGSLAHHINGALGQLASVVFIEQAIHRTIEWGAQLVDLSQRLGISVEAVQKFDYALKQNGSSIDALAPFFQKAEKARRKALEGNADMIRSFRQLGVSIDDLKNKRIEDITLQIGDAFKNGGDPQKLMPALMDVGGKGAGEFVAAMREGLREAAEEAEHLGIVLDSAVANRLKDTADRLHSFLGQLKTGFAPVVDFLVRLTEGLWRGLNSAMRGLVGLVTGGLSGMKELQEEYARENEEADEALKRKHEERAKPKTGGLDTENLEAEKAAKKSNEQRIKNAFELYEAELKTARMQMTAAEKLNSLAKERAEIAKAVKGGYHPGGADDAAKQFERIKQERLQVLEHMAKFQTLKTDPNALQRIGAYNSVSSTEVAVLNENKEQVRQLREIVKILSKQYPDTPAGKGGVQF